MRGKSIMGACLLAVAWWASSPAATHAQDVGGGTLGYAPPAYVNPLPLGSTRPEDGGLYVFGGLNFFRQNTPLHAQTIALRGIQITDSSVPAVVGASPGNNSFRQVAAVNAIPAGFSVVPGTQIFDGLGRPQFVVVQQTNNVGNSGNNANLFYTPGTFIGSGVSALDVKQLTKNQNYQLGFDIGFGWRFEDASSLALRWRYISQSESHAGATQAPRNGIVGADFSESYLYSPVFNFPPDYSGPDNKIVTNGTGPQPSAQAAYGLWNGATIMTINFVQRFQQYDATYRIPTYENEDYRISAVVGPRVTWLWERFTWRTTSFGLDSSGNGGATLDDIGVYSNVVSNRMYGLFLGCEQECYLGHGLALTFRVDAAGYFDSVKEIARYELANRFAGRAESKRSQREWTFVPSLQSEIGLTWYPTEGVQIHAGYEVMGFLNTLASRRPVDFDFTNLSPHYAYTSRLLDGFNIGLALSF